MVKVKPSAAGFDELEGEVGGKRLDVDRRGVENAAGLIRSAVGQFQGVPGKRGIAVELQRLLVLANPELKSKGWFGGGTPTLTPVARAGAGVGFELGGRVKVLHAIGPVSRLVRLHLVDDLPREVYLAHLRQVSRQNDRC